MTNPERRRLARLVQEFSDEEPTLPRDQARRMTRLLRLWRTCDPNHQILIERLCYELAPDSCAERRMAVPARFELRANRLLRLWQASSPRRQMLVEQLCFEFAPDQPATDR